MLFSRSVRAGALALMFCSLPALAHAETMREALTSAYINNPSILSALLNVKSTAENIALAKSAKLPTIGASITGSNSYTFDGNNKLNIPTVNAGVSYQQTIFDNFKSDADIEAARAITEASRYSLQNSEQNVFLAVVQAYMGVIRDTQLVQLRQENVKFYQAQVQSAKDRLDIGEGTKIDVSQAEARLAQGTASYQAAVASLQTSQASYERYVGHKPKNLTTTYRLGTLMPKSLESAIAEATSSHPAILAAKAGVRASQANSDAANAAFGPTLNFTSSIGSTVLGPGSILAPNDPSPRVSFKACLAFPSDSRQERTDRDPGSACHSAAFRRTQGRAPCRQSGGAAARSGGPVGRRRAPQSLDHRIHGAWRDRARGRRFDLAQGSRFLA